MIKKQPTDNPQSIFKFHPHWHRKAHVLLTPQKVPTGAYLPVTRPQRQLSSRRTTMAPISDSELTNLPALRRRFHALDDARMKAMARSIYRPEVLEKLLSDGTDEVAALRLLLEMVDLQAVWKAGLASESQRARRAPRAPQLDTKGSLRDFMYDLQESIGIGAELPPSSVELTSKLIERQIQFYEDEILAMRTDPNYLWDKINEDLGSGPGTAVFVYFVTADNSPAPKRVQELSFFLGRAFKAQVYHVYHFLSVWTWIGKAFKELKSLGYTTKTAERDILKNPKIHSLILQIKGVCLAELCQDLSHYFRRALASSARFGRFFDVEWDGSTVFNMGRYLEEVTVSLKPNALEEALPSLERSLLRLCDPETIWESPECFRTIDGYIRCDSVATPHITKRISKLLSEYASLTTFMDFLLRPCKAESIQELYRNSPIPSPTIPRRPGWDTSWTGLFYGGDPIYRLNFVPHMLKKFINSAEPDWLLALWKGIDNAYLKNAAKSINDYWEVAAVEERPPQWHDSRDPESSPYVPPSVASGSERVQSSHSYLKSSASPENSVKAKSRPTLPGEYPEHGDEPQIEIAPVMNPPPQNEHAVYELPRKTVKIIHRLLRDKIEGTSSEGKVTWKDICKVFRSLNFTIDDSTPGSAVNFIPPSPKDRPLTIHRPHPNPELTPLRIRQLGSRLRRVYGWSEDWFTIVVK
ncbi:hypothetical protein DFH09DRAFT_1180889 [Mycena vulgaris]|nr:hypothetical protein DFH09DRAFT_1180889 [Mycena vulgaris]